ncbi:TetR/AcrR family transcriptional regulator [Paracoccus sp. SSK6]|uniref:TetR/AcrR family transcriptional regulator n=1 Tax=Paracoccus sp. SSK6 TaxID=3143131 RepID=UPI0032196488
MKTPQSVSQGRKFRQVVRGAAAIFLRDGYAGASVDDIARAAQVSKATLYSYFPDKTLMFHEAMRAEVARLDFVLDIDPSLEPVQGIPRITAQVAAWLVEPAQIALYRIHVAEAARFADLSASFHEALTRMLRGRIRPCLDRWMASGLLLIDDTDTAAGQLVALAGMGLQEPALLGRSQAATQAAVQTSAADAAALFLRAHAPQPHRALRRSIGTR